MNLEPIKQELKAELNRIQSALSALDELDGVTTVKRTPASNGSGRRRQMSASARKRISMAQKARWAKQRKEAA